MNNTKCVLLGIVMALFAMKLAAQQGVSQVPTTEAKSVMPFSSTGTGQGRHVSQTELWLNLQVSGQASSRESQYATAVERELANQRLLDSYQHPIPEFFDQDASGEIGE